jgi:hypothetical protein
MPRIGFGPWTPDLPPLVNQKGVTLARDVVPVAGGYSLRDGLAPVTGATALVNRARGAIVGIDSAGVPFNFAGDDTQLYKIDASGAAAIPKAGGYSCFDDAKWQAAIFGDVVVFVNPNDETQYYSLRTSALFADLDSNAPRARHVGVIENFLVLGNIFDATLGTLTNALSWSARDNVFGWPVIGTEDAIDVQAGRQLLEGNGGWVQAVVSGSEVGVIFQERSIWRMEYRGGDIIFEFTRQEPDRGLLIPDLAVPFGRHILYCNEDGFYLFDYTTSKPIGKDRVNDYFFGDLDADYLDRVTTIRDPDETRIWISYPGSGNSSGTPNKLLVYDWAMDQWSHGDETIEMLAHAIGAGLHLDTADNPPTDPDVDGLGDDPPGDPYSVGDTTFDARVAAAGALAIGAYDTNHIHNEFTAQSPTGRIETGDLEMNPGQRSFVSEIRPLVDTGDVSVQVAALATRRSAVEYGNESTLDRDGKCSVRSDGRYHRVRVIVPPDSVNVTGLDIKARATGTN